MDALETLWLFVNEPPVNPMNGPLSRAHWSAKRQWSMRLRRATWRAMFNLEQSKHRWFLQPHEPRRVRFELLVARLFDDDALAPACKPIRDALLGMPVGGITLCALIHDDSPRSGHVFAYAQRPVRRSEPRGFWITLSPIGVAAKL